jgi:hypothetical protein
MKSKIETFKNVAKILNRDLDITPLLYGSLGLEYISAHDFEADDIDVLVPEIYIKICWEKLKSTIEKLEYELFDIHEHEFHKGDIKIAFASIESLKEYANIEIENIKVIDVDNCLFKVLSLSDFKNVYTESMKDGYRKDKGKNDAEKIMIIESLLVEL